MTSNNGNLKQQTITADPTHQWVQYYDYDEVNRLSIAAENAPLPANCTGFAGSWCREFDYDHFGNKATGSNRVMHQAKPVLLSQTNIPTNRLTTATYDAAGNMTSHPVLTPGGTITYDANNKKKTFTKTGLSVTTYYDANDRRVREDKVKGAVTTTTIWVYNAFGSLVAEYSDATPTVGDGVYYRTTDQLGSTRIVTDDTGSVRQRRDFFPFGEEIPGDDNHGNRNWLLDGGFVTYNASLSINQQFTGKSRDPDTELDDFLARCFCAPLGVFTGADPANAGARTGDPQSWNAYSYVGNNPLNFIDSDGRAKRRPQPTDPQPQWFPYNWSTQGPGFQHPLDCSLFPDDPDCSEPNSQFCRENPSGYSCPGSRPPAPRTRYDDLRDNVKSAGDVIEGNGDCRNLFGGNGAQDDEWKEPGEVLFSMLNGTFQHRTIRFGAVGPGNAAEAQPSQDADGSNKKVDIVIDLAYWDNANSQLRSEILIHELGHVYELLQTWGGLNTGGSAIIRDYDRADGLRNIDVVKQACFGGAADGS